MRLSLNSDRPLRSPLILPVNTPIEEAIALLLQEQMGGILVVDDQHHLLGLFTLKTIVRAIAQNHFPTSNTLISWLTPPPILLNEEDLGDTLTLLSHLQQQPRLPLPILNAQGVLISALTPHCLYDFLTSLHGLHLWCAVDVLPQVSSPTVSATTPLFSAIQHLAHYPEDHLLITHASAPDHPLGILTERDLVQLARLNLDFHHTTLEQVMSTPLLTLHPQERLNTVLWTMQQHHIQHLVLVHPDRSLAGVMTPSHLLQVYNPAWLTEVIENLQRTVRQQTQTLAQAIAQQHHLQQALATQEALYQAVVETQTELICRFQSDGTLTFANPAYGRCLGIDPKDLVGQNMLSFIHEGDRLRVQQYLQQLPHQTGPTVSEERMISKAGIVRWQEWVDTPIVDRQGHLLGFQGVGRDITDRKSAEAAMRESEERFRVIFEQAAVGIVLVDASGQFLRVNQRYCDIVGYTEAELLTLTFRDITHPDDVNLDREQTPKLFAGELSTFSLEKRYIHRRGSIRWVHLTISLVRDPQGKPQYEIVVVEDISDRKQAHANLRQREQEFRALVENTPDLIMRLDRQLQFCYVNPAVEQEMGLSSADILGKTSAELPLASTLVKQWHQAMQTVLTTGQEQAIEYTIPTVLGLKYYASRLVPEFTPEGTVGSILVVARDVSDLKQAELILRQQAEREQLLSEITQRIRQSLDLNEMLYCTVTEVRRFLQCDRVLLYPFSPQGGGMVQVESVAEGWMSLLGVPITDDCLAEHLILEKLPQGRVQRIHNLETCELSSCYVDFLQRLQVQASLVIPVLQGDHLWGLLVAHACQHPRLWQTWEVELLQQISSQVSIALQQSQLYSQTQQQAQQAQALNRVIQAIRCSLDLSTVFETATQEVAKLLHVDQVQLVRYLADQDLWEVLEDYHPYRQTPDGRGLQIADRDNPLAQDLKRHQVVRIHDTTTLQDPINRSLAETWAGAWLLVPLWVEGTLWGSLTLIHSQPRPWTDPQVDLVQRIADQVAIAIHQSQLYQRLKRANQELERLATTDSLTQIANRLRFDTYLSREWQRLTRDQRPLALILCDVDYFKRYNDTYGHPTGDDCLKRVAQALRSAARRPADLVARYGGEEFALILPNTDAEGAIRVSERVLDAIHQLQIPHETSDVSPFVTVSVGVSSITPSLSLSPHLLLSASDEGLYQAKVKGRDRYCFVLPSAHLPALPPPH